MAESINPTINVTKKTVPHTFTENGTYNVPSGLSYDPITVDVEGGGAGTVDEELVITENGTVWAEDGVRPNPIITEVPLPVDTTKTIRYNGTYDAPDLVRWNKVIVDVQSGGSGAGEHSPSYPFDAISTGTGGIYGISAESEINVVESGILGEASLGKKVLLILSAVNVNGISVSDFSQIYNTGLLSIWYGQLLEGTSITTGTSVAYCSAVAIDDSFNAAMYSDLCGEGFPDDINTSKLKTSHAFKISAKLPAGYGIFVASSSYDYNNADYRPMAWEALNKFIVKPEIVLRRVAEYLAGGFTVWLKINPAAYNQYFIRGSVNGQIVSDGNLLSPPSNISSILAFKDVPTWTSGNLSIAYIQLTEEATT